MVEFYRLDKSRILAFPKILSTTYVTILGAQKTASPPKKLTGLETVETLD